MLHLEVGRTGRSLRPQRIAVEVRVDLDAGLARDLPLELRVDRALGEDCGHVLAADLRDQRGGAFRVRLGARRERAQHRADDPQAVAGREVAERIVVRHELATSLRDQVDQARVVGVQLLQARDEEARVLGVDRLAFGVDLRERCREIVRDDHDVARVVPPVRIAGGLLGVACAQRQPLRGVEHGRAGTGGGDDACEPAVEADARRDEEGRLRRGLDGGRARLERVRVDVRLQQALDVDPIPADHVRDVRELGRGSNDLELAGSAAVGACGRRGDADQNDGEDERSHANDSVRSGRVVTARASALTR